MEDLKQIQEFFSKPLNEISKEDAWEKFQKEKSVTDKTIKAARKDFEKEWEAGNLNEVSGNIDLEDFIKVYQAIAQSGHPVTVLLSPMFGKNEIEIVIGMDAPDPIGDAMFNIMTDLGYKRGDYSIVGDTSTLSRRSYSDIRRVNGGHKDYQRWEESVNEAEYTDYSNNELAAYCKNNPTDRKAAKELHKRSQALKDLSRTDEATKEEETEFHTKLDKLVHDTFGKRKGELEESSSSEERRIAKRAIRSIAKYRGVSEDEARNDLIRAAKELGSLEENMSLDDQAKAYYLAKVKTGEIDTLPEDPKAAFLAQMTKDQMSHDKETLRRERGLEEKAAYIAETIKLGQQLNEELCDKGKRYIKARQAAGEKSSAYLSGRAVRVCKGQIDWPKKGKKK